MTCEVFSVFIVEKDKHLLLSQPTFTFSSKKEKEKECL